MNKKYALQTQLQHIGTAACDENNPVSPVGLPAIRTSTVRFNTLNDLETTYKRKVAGERVVTYGRMGMDTHAALEDAICALEGGERCFLAPSGLSAMSMAMLSLLSAGEHFIASDGVYGPLRVLDKQVLKRFNIESTYCSMQSLELLEQKLQSNTKVLYIESPSSLLFEMLDIPALSVFAKKHGLILVVDNTWGSGYIYKPLVLGADVSVVAGTKYIGGHSDLMLGAVIAKDANLIKQLDLNQYAMGFSISADDAWLGIRGVRTISVRMKQHAENAIKVCEYFAQCPELVQIYHPAWPDDEGHELWQRDCTGSNGMLSVKLNLSHKQARVFVDALQIFSIGYSWGGYESLVQLVEPSSVATHSYWKNSPEPLVRLHIGLEDTADVIADIDQALKVALATI